MDSSLVPILLLPRHFDTTSANRPLLLSVQKTLNDSYSKTMCAHPEIFGTSYLRIADPDQLAETIGDVGFTVVLLRVHDQTTNNVERCRYAEVVATGSVKDFGNGAVEDYLTWSKAVTGTQWKSAEGENHDGGKQGLRKKGDVVHKYEITAFGVAPNCQAAGLGARILKEIEWLVESDEIGPRLRYALRENAPSVEDMVLVGTDKACPVQGIDLDRLRRHAAEGAVIDEHDKTVDVGSLGRPKLVLMAIRETGNETYYHRRGFKTLWVATVPKEIQKFRMLMKIQLSLDQQDGYTDEWGTWFP
ncbi:hypothetical protein BU24DRAFT_466185 [Aaosphaeria arxii CBS 175.79]|uniref:Uncharacterized protein n=1 Tax=Aaosphaeria arxii CBS 175.79 TaxID=1450172 RepID=A0A6A5XEI8_9PLEO|nr:uncharacterized protein BU24DRAFT_466185 [Aaosphaeria arxii CBS 175.79]KAF2011482.1 hypothetical protein BU24DRAFT_466185 [Aaosphaeria arxii CBS 175.79]